MMDTRSTRSSTSSGGLESNKNVEVAAGGPSASVTTNNPADNVNAAGAPAIASNGGSNKMNSLIDKHVFNHVVDNSHKALEKEEHEKRLKELKKELDYINNSNWMFEDGSSSNFP